MSLPHLLLVDDSEAILNFEKAVLGGLYRLSTAANGVEALEKIRSLKPDGVLLDLSMPVMDGDEALRIAKTDPLTASTPFLVISSEKARAEACLQAGAEGLLHKPIVAQDLRARVALMLEAVQERERKKRTAYLFLRAGSVEMGLPLEAVDCVHSLPATDGAPPENPGHLTVNYYGEPVEILDLPRLLGVDHSQPLLEQKLVFLRGSRKLALCVDKVFDPEELLQEQIHRVPGNDGSSRPGQGTVLALAQASLGRVPVVDPEVFSSGSVIPQLARDLKPTGADR